MTHGNEPLDFTKVEMFFDQLNDLSKRTLQHGVMLHYFCFYCSAVRIIFIINEGISREKFTQHI